MLTTAHIMLTANQKTLPIMRARAGILEAKRWDPALTVAKIDQARISKEINQKKIVRALPTLV
jgi:hypothetical protein